MRLTTREMTQIGVFTAMHVAAAVMLRLGGEAMVPFSLVPFFVLLAGLLLGAKGAISLLLYNLLGLLGLPVFAAPPFGGLVYLLKPTYGFILGYALAAYIAGWLAERSSWRSPLTILLTSVAGVASLYLIGLPYLYLIARYVLGTTMSLKQLLAVGALPFIGLDLLKAGIAAAVAMAIRRRVPGFFPRHKKA